MAHLPVWANTWDYQCKKACNERECSMCGKDLLHLLYIRINRRRWCPVISLANTCHALRCLRLFQVGGNHIWWIVWLFMTNSNKILIILPKHTWSKTLRCRSAYLFSRKFLSGRVIFVNRRKHLINSSV